MILLALFFPTIYLLTQKKYAQAVITFILFAIGVGLCFLVVPLFISWTIAALIGLFQWKHAYREKRDEKMAARIGQQVAANIPVK